MDQEFENFKKLYDEELHQETLTADFIVDAAFRFLTKGNVIDILKLLASDEIGANEMFWKEINRSPVSDEDWEKWVYIVGEVSHEEYKRNMREKIELVRNNIDPLEKAAIQCSGFSNVWRS
ncbi:hypothetical protein ACJJIL_08255 [Microbulbifer sp. EKSA005]|uniref:hypothetical protein n=1 Tax=Microbulbifer sp. EKSA005 TaxID=3243364 RepID=UPI004041CBC8